MIKNVTSEDDMNQFGQLIGRSLSGGEVIELVGDVGAGKTTLTKGIAKGLGVEDYVQSPSFTISRVYKGRGDLSLVHYDFYRLDDAGIMADELGEDLGDNSKVVVIEWGGVVSGVLPHDRVTINLTTITDTERRLDIQTQGQKGASLENKIS
ncbi:tRNA (adenosine(37)-N6)-threonylcarbamoyltransferase complex ATPase subunit type 1 TsaE [Candidatus Saccharibacteria bacterium]|nr:tRNA (adenosine(37)-N6)-threonylcarbamoyltransferase complex ATPase subunit type 1 TsaE [Candidatus Saccharibacteria bacterium]